MSINKVYTNLIKGKHQWTWTYHFLLLVTLLLLFIAFDYGRFITSWSWFSGFNSVGIIWLGFFIAAGSLLQNLLYPNGVLSENRTECQGQMLTEEEERLTRVLLEYMISERPYLQYDLTVGQLAQELGVSSHLLSRVINQQFGKNYKELINQFRVDRAKELLKAADLKILAVALESGFSNKTTFNRTFKRFTGIPPSEYRIRNCTSTE